MKERSLQYNKDIRYWYPLEFFHFRYNQLPFSEDYYPMFSKLDLVKKNGEPAKSPSKCPEPVDATDETAISTNPEQDIIKQEVNDEDDEDDKRDVLSSYFDRYAAFHALPRAWHKRKSLFLPFSCALVEKFASNISTRIFSLLSPQ